MVHLLSLAGAAEPVHLVCKTCMRMNLVHVASGHLFLGETFFVSSIIGHWQVSMPPTKVFPQCKTAVPVRRKICERCDRVFRSKRKAECILREKAMKGMRAVVR